MGDLWLVASYSDDCRCPSLSRIGLQALHLPGFELEKGRSKTVLCYWVISVNDTGCKAGLGDKHACSVHVVTYQPATHL